MRTGREERRYEFPNCSHDCHPHNITFHLLLLLNLFLAPSIPIPTLQIISTHTFTICGSLLLCSSREPVSLSQHTLPRDICLSVRPSVSRVMCLSEAGKFNRNKRWSLAGRVFEPGTDKCDSLVVPPEVKKRGSKANMVVCLIFYTSYTTAALCYEPIPTCTSVDFSGVQGKNIDYLTRVEKSGSSIGRCRCMN